MPRPFYIVPILMQGISLYSCSEIVRYMFGTCSVLHRTSTEQQCRVLPLYSDARASEVGGWSIS